MVATVLAALFIKILISAGQRDNISKYVESEYKLNQIRKKEFDERFTVEIDASELPVDEKILELSRQKMVRFPDDVANSELKRIYGLNQLKKAVFYENNYYRLKKSLSEYAQALEDQENFADAEKIRNFVSSRFR
jgi:hypothetical protein